MDLVNKISLAEKNNKDFVLNNDNLPDEQKVILYNKFLKKHLFKTNNMSDVTAGSAVKSKKLLLGRV